MRILVRHDLVKRGKPRRRRTHPGEPPFERDRPNAVWTVDFKAEFRLGDKRLPFASTALGRLSRRSAWWVKLGIRPETIEPGEPQQNPRHERMHRTLKSRTAKPPSKNLKSQQTRFERFRRMYNEDRPHEALGQERPASVYEPSERRMPRTALRVQYPGHFEVGKVAGDKTIKWTMDRPKSFSSARSCVSTT